MSESEKDEVARELLEAVLSNNTPKIRKLIEDDKTLLNFSYPEKNKKIFLIACSKDGINAETVSILLDLNANPREYTEIDGWEALHWAASKTNYNILNVLLERNPDIINVVDKYYNNALHILIRYGDLKSPAFEKCIELLIEKGINVDQQNFKNQTPIYWAVKKKLREDVVEKIEKQKNKNNEEVNEGHNLVDYLKQNDTDNFINFKDGNIEDIVNYTDESYTLLQMCCEKNLTKAAIHLLNKGADHERTSRKNNSKPITIAAERGNSEIFKTLLDKHEMLDIPKGLLPTVVKYIDREYHDNIGCYNTLIEKMKKMKETHPDEVYFKLNEGDNEENTALYYAVLYAEQYVIEELLSLGASLGAKNIRGVMPIKNIDKEILKNHLDKCVTFDPKERKIDREDFKVKFNYRTLIQPYVRLDNRINLKADLEVPNIQPMVQKKLVAETEVIYFMAQTSELKSLLKHPTITSFLYLKWLQTHRIFWINLVCHLFLTASLLLPCSITNYEEHNLGVQLIYKILIMGWIAIMLKVLFLLLVAPVKFVTNMESYIEISLILIVTRMYGNIHIDKSRNELSAVAVLLIAFKLVLILGQHPELSTYVAILKTVSFNFYKFLIWYSLPIIAFAISFYLLFATNNDNSNNANSTNTDDSQNNTDDISFNHPIKSVFKTIIMLTGEFDSGNINFRTYPVTSELIFAAFIFTIAIILVNLLNGLAVSDTQMIKNDAELVGCIARTRFISNFESILTGHIFIIKYTQKLIDMCFPATIPRDWNYRLGQFLAKVVCLCPNLSYEMTFYPRKDGLIDSSLNENLNFSFFKKYLDRETILKTNNIIQEQSDKVTKTGDNNIIERIENKIDNILELLSTSKKEE